MVILQSAPTEFIKLFANISTKVYWVLLGAFLIGFIFRSSIMQTSFKKLIEYVGNTDTKTKPKQWYESGDSPETPRDDK